MTLATVAWTATVLATLLGLTMVAYFVRDTIEGQRVDIRVLVADLATSEAEVKRLGADITTLRERLQSVQAESKDASATAGRFSDST
jgi:hypothetical protein